MELEKRTGIVNWFSARKGYGFVTPNNGLDIKDVFVHWTGIAMEGYKQLRAEDHVEYELKDTSKGPVAINVVIVEST